jgi:hypothetical protein
MNNGILQHDLSHTAFWKIKENFKLSSLGLIALDVQLTCLFMTFEVTAVQVCMQSACS